MSLSGLLKQSGIIFGGIILVGFAVRAADNPPASGKNLLKNGSFEQVKPFCRPEDNNEAAKPFVNWDAAGGWHDSLHVGTIAVDGNVSVLFMGAGWISHYGIPVESGKTYQVTGWLQTYLQSLPPLPAHPSGVTLSWGELAYAGAYVKIDAGAAGTLWVYTLSGLHPWRQLSGKFTVPQGVKYVALTIGGGGGGGWFWADDFRVTELP